MKKICFFSGDITRSGGTERVTVEVANGLSKLNDKYSIYILSLFNTNSTTFFKITNNVEQHCLFNNSVNYKKNYIKIVLNIRKFLKENEIDIFVDVDSILDIFSVPATRFMKTKLVSWEHFNFYENLGVKFRDIGRKLASKYADHILTITEEDLGYFKENLHIKGTISNIYNPITLNTSRYQYNTQSKIIISAGRLTYQKGFDRLVDVASEVFRENDDWTWIVLGEGEDRYLIEDKIKKYNLQEKIVLKGNVSNIEDYYKESAIFVLTSRFEGLGMVILEALNNDIPVISFDCPVGPKEIIKDGENGYLIPQNNINEMANKINLLIQDDQRRISFSKCARKGLEKFDVNTIIKEWDSLLSSL